MKHINYSRNEWINLVSKYSDNKILINNTFNDIENCYSSSDRYYHNLSHIKFMLSEAENFRTEFNDYDLIRFSVWFHDIIYEANRSDNEERSADVAEAFLMKINYDKIKILNIKNLILKTKNHQNTRLNEHFDTLIFLDLDLLILGSQPEMYDKYAKNIGREYSFVPKKVYTSKRIEILKNFLNQKYIFKTETIRKLYEEKARINIEDEISSLSS